MTKISWNIFKIMFFVYYIDSAQCEKFNLFGDAGLAYAIEVNLGHPHQKLNLLVDTGSTTLAVASYPRQDSDKYFHADNSSSIYDSGKEILELWLQSHLMFSEYVTQDSEHAKPSGGTGSQVKLLEHTNRYLVHATYFQGKWVGHLASDYIQFPSLPSVPEVRSDIALITKSHKFFMNRSGWQGLLGLAYLPVGAWGDSVVVESWLDSLDRATNKPMSFQLKLCATQSLTNATHYGRFHVLDDEIFNENRNEIFQTPILRKRWYEVGVIAIKVITPANITGQLVTTGTIYKDVNKEMCQTLNKEKSIVDSGTTNIRLPDAYYRQIVNELRSAAQSSNMLILDDFWYHGEAACWPEPQQWALPWLGIDLLNSESEDQYFTLELSPQNYMRVVTAHNSSGESGIVSEFCYKLGLEAGGKETVLGYTAMEGLEVLFNRSAGWIGWQTSDCGPGARITGPYNVSGSLIATCELVKPVSDGTISIKAAQWILCAISVIAAFILIYLLIPCIKTFFRKPLPNSTQISLSRAALVDRESN